MRRVVCDECSTDAEVIYAEPPHSVMDKETWLLRLRCKCMDIVTETYSNMLDFNELDGDEPLRMKWLTSLRWKPDHAQRMLEDAERKATLLLARHEALRAWLTAPTRPARKEE